VFLHAPVIHASDKKSPLLAHDCLFMRRGTWHVLPQAANATSPFLTRHENSERPLAEIAATATRGAPHVGGNCPSAIALAKQPSKNEIPP
jgi:hypothetical protein